MNQPIDSQPQGKSTPRRTLAEAHLDISLGDSYRIEYIKHLISIAAGIFVFSVTFMKDIIGPNLSGAQWKFALLLGWVALVVSIVGGAVHMRLWSAFYINWGLHFDKLEAKRTRNFILRSIRIAEGLQFVGFFAGLIALLCFAIQNLKL